MILLMELPFVASSQPSGRFRDAEQAEQVQANMSVTQSCNKQIDTEWRLVSSSNDGRLSYRCEEGCRLAPMSLYQVSVRPFRSSRQANLI